MHYAGLERLVAGAGHEHFGAPRFQGYVRHCGGDLAAALVFYQWNVEVSGALWQTIGHLEVVLRNRVADRLALRRQRLGRPGSWLDDSPASELDMRARADIRKAQQRLQYQGRPINDGRVIAELTFGFWRFLFARRYTSLLWPDIVGAFPNVPNRQRETLEAPVVRLHEFRNRLAHHERIWNQPLSALHADALTLLNYIDTSLARWVTEQSRVPELLASCPVSRPHP
ncbi:hypothetical protein ACIA49_18000 [Kribbella sp. NPDC051587]|uniref:hypothetical protein n=1 Tax=Kribbella sp. NPDC051587 TaxID=3364119 RepID=UPI0037AD9278